MIEQDFQRLDWVRNDIDSTLQHAQQTLEAFVNNPDDTSRMRFCLTYLHQVYGTLQLVEFYGAALLAEEMEKLASALLNEQVEHPDDAQEVLMRAILQLPIYLDRIKESRRDMPVVILPLLNDLRASRGEKLLSETSLFKPDFNTGNKVFAEKTESLEPVENVSEVLKKIRQLYQYALVGLIRNQDIAGNLEFLSKSLGKLQKVSAGSPVAQLWWVARAVIEGTPQEEIESSTSLKMLFGMMDREIKKLVDDGGRSNDPIPAELLKNLLYYVAKSTVDSPRVTEIKDAFKLQQALPNDATVDTERRKMSGPDRQAMASVAVALSEELARVKDSLDLFVRGDQTDPAQLQPLNVELKQIADTLAVLGMGIPRRVVLEQLELINQLVTGVVAVDSHVLMDIAGALLYVEATLNSLSDDGASKAKEGADASTISPDDIDDAESAVVRESLLGLEVAKDDIIGFISSGWDATHLENVPNTLTGVRGGLNMIGLTTSGDVLDACVSYVRQRLLTEDLQVEGLDSEMDTLADALTSVEYFLERYQEDRVTHHDKLAIAVESVACLGHPIDGADLPEKADAEPELEIPSLKAPMEVPVLSTTDDGEESLPVDNIPERISDNSDISRAVESQEGDVPPELETPLIETPSSDDASDDEDLVDDEVIEIFLEEAEEVLATLNACFPRWKESRHDAESLTEVRRAFHTLKGSGRLVGATLMGEFAWSVENLLNRVIDGMIATTDDIVELVGVAIQYIPDLVAAFRNGQSDVEGAEALQEEAYALAEPQEESQKQEESKTGEAPTFSVAPSPVSTVDKAAPESAQEVGLSATAEAQKDALCLQRVPQQTIENADDVDAEILEIFLEEAQEVQEAIADHYPQWKTDHRNKEALAEVRRAFHTLKGSGRLVGATHIGELSWSVENLLNHVIEATVSLSSSVFIAIDRVLEVLPPMVQAFEGKLTPPIDVEPLSHAVHALAEGAEGDDVEIPAMPVAEEIDVDESEVTGEPYDPVLMKIFYGEAKGHIGTVEQFLSAVSGTDSEISADLQRALHTLKGSANMAGIEPVVAIVSPVENFIKECFNEHILADKTVQAFLHKALSLIKAGVEQLETEPFKPVPGTDALLEELVDLNAKYLEHISEEDSLSRSNIDPQLVSIFIAEGMDLIVDAADLLNHWRHNPVPGEDLTNLRRELRLLAKAAGSAGLDDVVALAMSLEACYTAITDKQLEPDTAFFDLASEGHEGLIGMMDRLASGQRSGSADDLVEALQSVVDEATLPATDTSIDKGFESDTFVDKDKAQEPTPLVPPERRDVALEVSGDYDAELVSIFLEEAGDIMESTAASLQRWIDNPRRMLEIEELQRDLHTLKGGARMSDLKEIGDLSHELENLYEGLSDGRFKATSRIFDLLLRCHDRLSDMLDALATGNIMEAATDLIGDIANYVSGAKASVIPIGRRDAIEGRDASESVGEGSASSVPSGMFSPEDEDVDSEIIEIFSEEAVELAEAIDLTISQWMKDRRNTSHLMELQRLLHTLKGGARLAGLTRLGDLSHDFETFLIGEEGKKPALDDAYFETVFAQHDALIKMMDQLRGIETATVESTPETEVPVEESAEFVTEAPKVPETTPMTPLVEVAEEADIVPLVAREVPEAEPARAVAQDKEMVRVPAALLESLVNLAGETSISRGRIETEINEFGYVLEEVGMTVDRLREQLRRLELETEAQIISRFEREGVSYEDFDPLEMDQYSQLHQYSRSLSESASDLMDLKDTLSDRARDTETLLLQQARVNTELQEGLMRTRMVPFSRMIPRLRRVVRQVAGELGKQVHLEVLNAEGEMDRTVLERVVTPLEHMLRNAVDHGIEMPEERKAKDKDPTGRITLLLTREGGDVVLRLSDDGKGIDLSQVREKAIERGLMAADAKLSDNEIMQFIFRSGFSTAAEVTQISGRGVGMDVVNSEIKQMGGSMKIHSASSVGSQFTIRLPFTVSVNRALMVKVGDDAYAVPLNQIEGIVRVSPYELDAYYQPDAPPFEYAGQKYSIRYLGAYVHGQMTPNLQGQTKPLPVLLVRRNEHTVALQVDSLIGSREIVVKSVGPQLSMVSGLSGATILGDGSVVIILDVMALIRADVASQQVERYQEAAGDRPSVMDEKVPMVMVIDDSVTVRKVTTRLLERNGYDCLTAKDGVDAITKLQEVVPECILLDIEMPRMDGFEVATQIRHDDRLKHIPIIMITSRTGEKHRERALGIGVNEYMGKPFQETELLANIDVLIRQNANDGGR